MLGSGILGAELLNVTAVDSFSTRHMDISYWNSEVLHTLARDCPIDRNNGRLGCRRRSVGRLTARPMRQSERRNHLDLQINLLAEKEATSILRALSEIAKHFQIDLSTDAESRELTEDTAVESIARDLRSKEKEASSER